MCCRLGYFRPWGELSLLQGQGLYAPELCTTCAAQLAGALGVAERLHWRSCPPAMAQPMEQWPLFSTARSKAPAPYGA